MLIAEQYAISVDQLACLIGRSYRTARSLRDRWHRAGWISSRQLESDGPSFIWLSREGTRVAQTPYRNRSRLAEIARETRGTYQRVW